MLVTTLEANPKADRQLPEDPHLLLLWRDDAWGRREGLLLVTGVCPFPGCPDRRVLVEGYLVPDSVARITHDAGDLRFQHHGGGEGPRPGRVFGVCIGLDDAGVEVVDPVWSWRAVAWLEGALDAEVRAALARRFEQERARIDAALSQGVDAVLDGLRRGLVARADDRRLGPRRAPKVGRNEPCPCGSGRKYKRCCLGAA